MSWQPSASLRNLRVRAQCYQSIRTFFSRRDVLEVDTPVIGRAATVDPHIESLSTQVLEEGSLHTYYLQTSPEFYLKRLLAAGSGDIYSLSKAFRQGERGCRHRPEFTLLEWYRNGWDEHCLMAEVCDLIHLFFPAITWEKVSYATLFRQHFDLDPHVATIAQLEALAKDVLDVTIASATRDIWLDLLMSHCIEPQLPEHLVLVYDYPATQAALAAIGANDQGQRVARRFEVYLNAMELANGYFELTDAREQKQRFERDLKHRASHGLVALPYDDMLVEAMTAGLPACAGVALGLDRLLMLLCEAKDITEVISFS